MEVDGENGDYDALFLFVIEGGRDGRLDGQAVLQVFEI